VLELTEVRTETVGQSDLMKEKLREAAQRERVMTVVRAYVEGLREKYGVVENDSLLATLDYASEDPEVLDYLRASQDVVAELPWTRLTVADFTRKLRFDYFHGLKGKPEAGSIRDRVFDEWITELLLRHEAAELGFDDRPELVDAANRFERELVREAVVNQVLDFEFDPSEEEIAEYYRENQDEFLREPRFRAEGVHLDSEESAKEFRRQVEAGAKVGWLAERADGVLDPRPAIYSEWLEPELLRLEGQPLEEGMLIGPLEADDFWVVARITRLEPPEPMPLESCRGKVLARMRQDRSHERMSEALERLESAATIEVAEDAESVIQRSIDEWLGTSTASVAP
jgi:hypothetical protein